MRPATLFVKSVIANLLDLAVGVGIEAGPCLALVNAARDHVKQVWNHATAENELPIGVAPIHAPWVAGAFGKDFELPGGGLVAPDAGVELDCILRLRFRLVDI